MHPDAPFGPRQAQARPWDGDSNCSRTTGGPTDACAQDARGCSKRWQMSGHRPSFSRDDELFLVGLALVMEQASTCGRSRDARMPCPVAGPWMLAVVSAIMGLLFLGPKKKKRSEAVWRVSFYQAGG